MANRWTDPPALTDNNDGEPFRGLLIALLISLVIYGFAALGVIDVFLYLIGLGTAVLAITVGIVRGIEWLAELDNDMEL